MAALRRPFITWEEDMVTRRDMGKIGIAAGLAGTAGLTPRAAYAADGAAAGTLFR